MKPIHVIAAIVCCLFVTISKAQTSVKNFTNLEEAVSFPDEVIQLKIEAGSPFLDKFIEQAGRFTSLEEVCILGFNNAEELNAVIDKLALVPTLKKVISPLKGIEDLPANIRMLNQLTSIELIPASNLKSGNYNKLKDKTLEVAFVGNQSSRKLITIEIFAVKPKVNNDAIDALVKVFPNAVVTGADVEHENLGSFTSGAVAQQSAQAFTKEYKNIKPPIKGVNVVSTDYRLNPNINNTVTYKSGTQIYIPDNCFVDAEGNIIKGHVDFHYREFRDQAEMLVSGIPMGYDSAGVNNNFESAGMFEMLASQNGQEVFMNPERQVRMDFSSTNASPTFNFYNYDDETGNWDYRGKAGAPDQIKVNKQRRGWGGFSRSPNLVVNIALSNAWRKFRRNDDPKDVPEFDATKMTQRFMDSTYFFTYDSTETKFTFARKNLARYQADSLTTKAGKKAHRTIRKAKLISLDKWKGEKKRGQYWFTLDPLNRDFPELAAMKGLVWVYDGDMQYRNIRRKYFYKQSVFDLRIKYLEAEETFELTLKTADGLITMRAYPRYANLERGHDRAKKRYSEIAARYNALLAKRVAKFDGRIDKKNENLNEIQVFNATYRKEAYEDVKPRMSPEETEMSYGEWLNYYNRVCAFKSGGGSGNLAESGKIPIVRALAVDGFGVWNCDQIQRIENGVQVLASYKTKKGQKIAPTTTFVVDENLNGVLRYDGYMGLSPYDFAISSTSASTILTIDAKGNLAYVKKANVRKLELENRKRVEIEVTAVDYGISSIDDLRDILGI